MIVVTLICVWLGMEKARVLRQSRVAATVRGLGGDVFLGYRFDPQYPKDFSPKTVPVWLTNLVGEEYFLTVVTVNFTKDGSVPLDSRFEPHASRATDESLSLLHDTPDVRELLLSGNSQLTDECLVHAAGLRQLRVLTLNDTHVKGSGLRHLRRCKNLKYLSLYFTPATDDGLVYLKDLPKLESLELSMTWITDAGLAHLKGLPKLKLLSLRGTDITDAGLSHLASLKSLQQLGIEDTKITDAGLAHIRKLTGLQSLGLNRTLVSNEGYAELQRSLPQCKISGR